jgi:hypothetical protein
MNASQKKYGEENDSLAEAVSGLRGELKDALEAIRGGERIAAAKLDAELRGKVTAPGYTEEFVDIKSAQKVYEKLIKKMAKNTTTGVVKLFVEDVAGGRGKWKNLAKWNANEDAFD